MSYKMTYPGSVAYTFPTGPKYTSPCQDPFWRAQPIRQGKKREEIDFDEKQDEEEE